MYEETVFIVQDTRKINSSYMASQEQIFLSDYIKSVHQKLRDDSKTMGLEKAWFEHCKNEDNLEKYATAMKNLATNYWDEKYKKDFTGASRVEWVHDFCKRYFTEEEFLNQRQKETKIADKICLELDTNLDPVIKENLQLLDVGSCYNPFKKYSRFNVTSIDIAPASSDVHKCDFLNVKVTSAPFVVNSDDSTLSEISELPQNYFHVVIFSLLLEYLPSPVQRHLCCEKAYNLLKTEGILIIITPDSKHVGANAVIMKSWRFVLAKLGFSRIKYEKLPHLHCMVFRKSLKKEIAQRWALLQNEEQFFNEIVIPQDFKKSENVATTRSYNKIDCDINLFEELPLLE